MGTSSMYEGPKDNRLLPEDYFKKEENSDSNKIDPEAWKKTKNAMSKFISANRGNLKKVMNRYASANGGSTRTAQNATSGIKGIATLGTILTKAYNSSFDNVMKEYGIDYQNKSMDMILSEFVNIISPEANTKEECVGREALIRTLSELYEIIEKTNEGIEYFNKLDETKFNFIINKYIENYIFTKFLKDLEYRVEKYADNIERVMHKENDIKDFIRYSVNNATKNINFKDFDYKDLKAIEKIYKECYEIWEDE